MAAVAALTAAALYPQRASQPISLINNHRPVKLDSPKSGAALTLSGRTRRFGVPIGS